MQKNMHVVHEKECYFLVKLKTCCVYIMNTCMHGSELNQANIAFYISKNLTLTLR